MFVIIQVRLGTRFTVYSEDGYHKENFVDGIGWVLNTEEEALHEDYKIICKKLIHLKTSEVEL